MRNRDRFVVEFKIGYLTDKSRSKNDFVINTWVFVPDNLGINALTYSKNQFYRDVNSIIRLVTPVYALHELAEEEALPFRFLEVAFRELASTQDKSARREAEYQIKMFCSIVKSALRREVDRIRQCPDGEEQQAWVLSYEICVRKIIRRYRALKTLLPDSEEVREVRLFHAFGDESLSNRVERQSFRLLQELEEQKAEFFSIIKQRLLHAFAHRLEPCEVDDPVDLMRCKHLFQLCSVAHIAAVEGQVLSRDLLHAPQALLVRVAEVIHNDHFIARLKELHNRMRADKTRAARYKNCHIKPPFYLSSSIAYSIL